MQWNDKKIKAPLNPPEGGKLPSFGGVGGGSMKKNFTNFINFITLQTKKIWIIQYK